jgi:site-specific DNA-methyltransferase (adenine-specific)
MDCMEYMSQIPDDAFDLAIVDPPYGLDKKSTQGSGKLKGRCLNRGNISKWDIRPDKKYFDELFRVSRNQII